MLTYLQKFIASLADDREVVFQDVLVLHRYDVAIRWRHRIRARLSCAEETRPWVLMGQRAIELALSP